MTNLKGTNRKNKHYVHYPDVSSVAKTVPNGPDLSVPNVNVTVKYSAESKVVYGSISTDYDIDDQAQAMPFTQG